MNHYKYKVKQGWRKSAIFQDDVITMAVNAFNKVVQSEIDYETECDYVSVCKPLNNPTKLCYVNDSLMLETTREELLEIGLIFKEEKK